LHAWHRRLAIATFPDFLSDLAERCGARSVIARLEFPLFLERRAPVSGGGAFVPYDCVIEGPKVGDRTSCVFVDVVPITIPCPCSREISDYGGNNQRGAVEPSLPVDPSTKQPLDIIDLIELAEQAGSAPIYSLLKRTDERYVTMQAYTNPAF